MPNLTAHRARRSIEDRQEPVARVLDLASTKCRQVQAHTIGLIGEDRAPACVAQALRVQSDSMRVRRRQLAEEKAAKTAVKLIFPLVMFIFPGIFVVLVGPAAITVVNDMLPMMQGS